MLPMDCLLSEDKVKWMHVWIDTCESVEGSIVLGTNVSIPYLTTEFLRLIPSGCSTVQTQSFLS